MVKYFKITLFIAITLSCASCLTGRFVWYNFANITDYKIFPNRPLLASATPFHFVDAQEVGANALKQVDIEDFAAKAAANNTVALLIIRNDSILFERYYAGYRADSSVASFSMAKSYTSALVGVAIQEGFIHNVDDSITKYLPELATKKGFNKITIRHLLQMTSGIAGKDNYYTPTSMAAKLYYGGNLRKYLHKLKIAYPPGQKFSYRSINTQLLGLIVERASARHLTDYLNEKIWQPLSMEYEASWSVDRSDDKALEKTFCCINAKARDYAKFGRLYLRKGNWNGQQLINENWVTASTTADKTNGGAPFYKFQWWLASTGFYANGFLGQYIFVNPSKNLIIVRLGKSNGKIWWRKELDALSKKL